MFQGLRLQILLILVAPILALGVITTLSISENLKLVTKYDRLRPIAAMAGKASALIHELQKERGRTAGLISSGFEAKRAEALQAQRALTDPAFQAYVTELETQRLRAQVPELDALLTGIDGLLAGIPSHRQAVDSRSMTVPENIAFYTGIIEELIKLIEQSVKYSPSESLAEQLLPFIALVVAKENAGLERALGSVLLNQAAAGTFQFGRFLAYHKRLAGEEAGLKEFESFALPEHKAIFKETVRGPEVDQVRDWRKVIAAIPETRDAQGVSGKVWFDTATKRINLFKAVEDRIAEGAQAVALQEVSAVTRDTWVLVIVDVITAICAVGVGTVIALRVSGPILSIRDCTRQLVDGVTEVVVPFTDRRDEIGDMAQALKQFQTTARENVELQRNRLKEQERAMQERVSAIRVLSASVEQEIVGAVSETQAQTNQLLGVAQGLKTSVDRVQANASNVSARAEASLGNTEQAAAAADELTSSIQEISESAARSASISSEARRLSEETKDVVNGMSTAVESVGEVVKVISDIAEQTNLLALNATIEAARAGDAGKGFAVVANEVKNLANQTQRSTSEIDTQVAEMQSVTRNAVEAMGRIAEIIERISEGMTSVASAVQEQSASTGEISRNIEETTSGAREVTNRIGEVSRDTSAIEGMAGDVAEASQTLNERVGELRERLVAIVERAAPDSDRRSEPRYILEVKCNVEVSGENGEDGRSYRGQLQDISAGGAKIALNDEGVVLAEGTLVSLISNEVGLTLPMEVVWTKGSLLHLRMAALSAPQKVTLDALLQRLPQQSVAA